MKDLEARTQQRPFFDRKSLLDLAYDLPSAWNAGDARTQQRLTRILVQEVVIEHDTKANQVVAVIHWTGGRHSEVRVAKMRSGGFPNQPSPVEVMRKLGGRWPDRELAVTLNRMRSKAPDGKTWTTTRVRDLRERLRIAAFDSAAVTEETISVDETAARLKICVGSVKRLIRDGVLPAKQLMAAAPWQVPVTALGSEAVKIGVRAIIERRPRNFDVLQENKSLRLPGF